MHIPHEVVEWFGLAATVILALWGFRRQDRKEREDIRMAAAAEQKKQHEENAHKLDYLVGEQEERPNHEHIESSGVLTVDGIRYNPRLRRK